MSLRKLNTRKRHRSVAFPDGGHDGENDVSRQQSVADESVVLIEQTGSGGDAEAVHAEGNTIGEDSQERLLKEHAAWENFREEHYEVLEQLPLSLHRAYKLVNELDEQVHTGNVKILQHVHKYIAMRRALTQTTRNVSSSEADATSPSDKHTTHNELRSPTKRPEVTLSVHVNGTLSKTSSSRASYEGLKDLSLSTPSPPPETSRSVIADLAWVSEDVMRAANEKLNVARFACDLIDRYIRDIDREIKEQETSLSLGLRPGTHPAAIVLPEVVLPKPIRPPRIQDSPISEEPPTPPSATAEVEQTTEELLTADVSTEPADSARGPSVPPRRKSRSHGWSKKKKPDNKERKKETEEQENSITEILPPAPDNETKPPVEVERDRSVTRLIVTLPPLASLQQPVATEPPSSEVKAVNPDEERYCYCNGFSYGEMVGCDGCDGWFHLGCIDEQTIPKGKWYCRDCAPTKGHGRPRAKHTRKRR